MNILVTEHDKAPDLSECEREPIHIPGAIQPHGFLIKLSEPDFFITHASSSTVEHLDIDPAELLGKSISTLIDKELIESLLHKLAEPDLDRHNPHQIYFETISGKKLFEGVAHRFADQLIFEFEPSRQAPSISFSDFYHQARESVQRLRGCKNLKSLFETTVAEVHKITGFDRVLVYRFDSEWNGQVIGEAKRADHITSYLGLHFPASDIPKQARDLYTLNRLRIIPTVDHIPSHILSNDRRAPQDQLDLSMSVLRAVSPVHLEYLRNMKVSASMSVSLIKDDRLWGLITCTHESGPLFLSYDVRAICDFIGETVSSLLPLLEHEEDSDYRHRLLIIQSRLLQRMSSENDFIAGLIGDEKLYLELANATGGAIYFGGKLHIVGDAPEDHQLHEIINWLSKQQIQDVLCETSLPKHLPSAEISKSNACGLIAFSISRAQANYFIWFRPEVIQTVEWGGNPTKFAEPGEASGRLHPRKSFELWKETVRLKSLPWKQEERQAVSALKSSIIEIVLQRTERLSRLNTELERSNNELDSFAYAASHDLKEPLRGIYNYVNLVLRDDGHLLPVESSNRLLTVSRLAQRMEDLINSLLHYAQIGRAEIFMRATDLNEVVRQALESVRNRIEEEHVEIVVAEKLPSVICDRVQIVEVFTNLFSNAIKYNLSDKKIIELSYAPNPKPGFSPIFCVSDNGIGIDENHHQSIFKIFKRLHPKERFGGGTGTGLTITQKVIERHGGSIWIESEVGKGTRFYFTIMEGRVGGD